MVHSVYPYCSSTNTARFFFVHPIISFCLIVTNTAAKITLQWAMVDGAEDGTGLQNTVSHCRLWTSASKHTRDSPKYWRGFNMSSIVKKQHHSWISVHELLLLLLCNYDWCNAIRCIISLSVIMTNSDLMKCLFEKYSPDLYTHVICP